MYYRVFIITVLFSTTTAFLLLYFNTTIDLPRSYALLLAQPTNDDRWMMNRKYDDEEILVGPTQ